MRSAIWPLITGGAILLACSELRGPTEPPSSPVAEEPSLAVAAPAASASSTDPRPGAGDRVLLDTRASLQRANSLKDALALFGHNAKKRKLWGFTTTMDRSGTHALRIDWPKRKCYLDDDDDDDDDHDVIANLGMNLSKPYPRGLYVQWKQQMGRTATGGGIGAVGQFKVNNALCGKAGRKVWKVLRDGKGHSTHRLTLAWPGPAPSKATVSSDGYSKKYVANTGNSFDPQAAVGRTIVQTLFYQAESRAGKKDGVIRYWVDGKLIIEVTDAQIGAEAMRRFAFPGAFDAPAMDQSEYFWDVLLWEGKAGPSAPVLSSVVISPSEATLAFGEQLTFGVIGKMSDGTDRSVAVRWAATGGTIDAAGTYTAGPVAGRFRVIVTETGSGAGLADTAEITISAPPTGPTGDPTKLPVAQRQVPDFASYPGRGLAAGASYIDPVTGVRVWKATSAIVPVANDGAMHDYASGPVQASRAWGGGTSHTILTAAGAEHYLVDFTRGVGFTNWRVGPAEINSDLAFTFSYKPLTPQIAYYAGSNELRRYDVTTNSNAPLGHFPKSFAARTTDDLIWIQQDKNDEWFVVMPRDESQVIAWNSVTDQMLVMTGARLGMPINEPHLERDGRYVMLSVDVRGVFAVWDLQTDTFWTDSRPENHGGAIRGLFVSNDPDPDNGPQFRYDFAARTFTEVLTASQLSPDLQHHADQWVQSDADLGGNLNRQWVLNSTYGEGLVNPAGGWTLDADEVYSTHPDWRPEYEKPEIGVQSVRQFETGDVTRIARQLTKATSRAAMTEGSFYYDEATTTVYVWAQGGGDPTDRVAIRAPGTIHDGIGFFRADGSDVRMLVHHYTTNPTEYWHSPRATVSPDGMIVLFTSDMNDSDGRTDVFVAEVPMK